jgi:hypothetical protein
MQKEHTYLWECDPFSSSSFHTLHFLLFSTSKAPPSSHTIACSLFPLTPSLVFCIILSHSILMLHISLHSKALCSYIWLSLLCWCWHVQIHFHHHFQALGIFCIFSKKKFLFTALFHVFGGCMKNYNIISFEISKSRILECFFFFFFHFFKYHIHFFKLLTSEFFLVLSHSCWVL